MDPQQSGKRSIALPITLIIIVFSLIGNVFLYSQYLHNKQQNKFEKGQTIYKTTLNSMKYVEGMIVQLDALLQSKSLDERYAVIFESGKVAEKGHALAEFTVEAASVMAQPEKLNTELSLAYVSDVEKGLQTIGRYDGPLNESDRVYASELKSSFEAISGVLKGFNTNIGESRIAIIRLSSGLDWVELAQQVQNIMEEQTADLPQ